MEIDTGLEISTARFGCACYGFRIGNRFGVEAIQKYLEMCNIGVFDDFSRMGFLERKHGLEMDGETHSKVNYLSCWYALGIAQARRITEHKENVAP